MVGVRSGGGSDGVADAVDVIGEVGRPGYRRKITWACKTVFHQCYVGVALPFHVNSIEIRVYGLHTIDIVLTQKDLTTNRHKSL